MKDSLGNDLAKGDTVFVSDNNSAIMGVVDGFLSDTIFVKLYKSWKEFPPSSIIRIQSVAGDSGVGNRIILENYDLFFR